MTEGYAKNDEVILKLSKPEALVFFEWLSRNWERNGWGDESLFSHPAERQILMWLEADLEKILSEPFDRNYKKIIEESYNKIYNIE